MQRYTVTRYEFSELSPEAQERAVNDWRDDKASDDCSWWLTPLLEDHLDDQLGSEDQQLNIYYSLSYCQGDGVALEGRITPATAPLLTWPAGAAYAYFKHSGHYSHAYSFSCTVEADEGDEIEGPAVDVLLNQLREVCFSLEKIGYKALEADLEESNIREEIENNTDADFTAEGKLARITEPQEINA